MMGRVRGTYGDDDRDPFSFPSSGLSVNLSPDGKWLDVRLRENARRQNAQVTVSEDEGDWAARAEPYILSVRLALSELDAR
jgi:hypothetical protein